MLSAKVVFPAGIQISLPRRGRKGEAMTIQEIETEITAYVIDSFLSGQEARTFRSIDDLFRVLDSLQVLRTVLQLEAMFGIKVADSELTAANLGSVKNMAEFVARKRQ
jgi:acyl carrier protein